MTIVMSQKHLPMRQLGLLDNLLGPTGEFTNAVMQLSNLLGPFPLSKYSYGRNCISFTRNGERG